MAKRCLSVDMIFNKKYFRFSIKIFWKNSIQNFYWYYFCFIIGILTGSVYKDHGLMKSGFPAEQVKNNSVLVVKTHEWGNDARSQFSKAILLVRSPADAILVSNK